MVLKNLNEKNSIIMLAILTVIILLIPLSIRLLIYDNSLIGSESYYHARIAQTIADDGILTTDQLSYGGATYLLNPYHLVISNLSKVIPLNSLLKITPFIFGILSFILFYLILKKLKVDLKTRFLTNLIFLSSPIFIYLFTSPNQHSIPFVLTLLTFYFFISKQKYFLIPLISVIIIPLFGLFHAITLILLLASYITITRKRLKRFMILFFAVLITSFLKFIPLYLQYTLPTTPSFLTFNLFNMFISDFGASMAFGIFTLFLSFIGFASIKKNHQDIIFYLLAILMIIISYHIPYLRIYLNLITSFLTASAIFLLLKRKWELKLIKTLTILVMMCGLIFSTTSYINRISHSDPDNEITLSLEWLNNQPKGVVFSHYSKGLWIESIANKPTVMDELFDYAPNVEQRYNHSHIIFNSRNIKTTTELLDKYNVRYIWLDKKMKTGQVWEKENQGLLFLLKNSERFKRAYHLGEVEIWTYT
ncbi:hypothetical protein ISS04_01580 [Candidatus Woesearchaeota archaeon]|nr:hypothetical protein [Candidatus Woesearchaeota archaeon]